ncbi:hypothetical protein K1T71_010601 [Dendrolimus kikuchii]|uniref:Uncharacterized protein n=1 Tax=Dendrolimus kikuchii TaxID=765133 RepID=A0ACC1CPQ1_9NEOP|nr:hypothetical protein K1T71_010601 [Dendrolimus kikuchii]
MEFENLQVVLLHKYPKFLRACCEMINEEWRRSETARMMSLQASCDDLPTSLILIDDNNRLLGHCKLSRIPSIPESCFVETVVINKEMRGKKLGSFLMQHVEKYCKDVLTLKMIHLSTKGQENFYAKLGYNVCGPISIYGVIRSTSENQPKSTINKVSNPVPNQEKQGLPPPTPPPMPKIDLNEQKIHKTFMFKYLS